MSFLEAIQDVYTKEPRPDRTLKPGELRKFLARQKIERICRLLEKSDKTRSELVKESDIPWTTVYDILFKLEMKGKVRRYSKKSEKGRPSVYWKLLEKLQN
ncbi:MAG: helix-turn-helix domain-containing protein [Candidatus Odinarchaeota archaeon]